MKVARRSKHDKTRSTHAHPCLSEAGPRSLPFVSMRNLLVTLPARDDAPHDASKPPEHRVHWDHIARLTPFAWRSALAGLEIELLFRRGTDMPPRIELYIHVSTADGCALIYQHAARDATVRIVRQFLLVGARAVGVDVDPYRALPLVQITVAAAEDSRWRPATPPPTSA